MKKVAASDAKNRFGSLLDEAAMNGCIEIVKHGRVVGILLSPKAYEEILRSSACSEASSWGSAHMIAPAKARAAKIIQKPAGFDE